MFNPTEVVIEAFSARLQEAYLATYSCLEPSYPGILGYVGRMALEAIANSDAPYHDVSHTIMVTQVGQEILKGKHLHEGGISPREWLHFVVSLLCHDIGYVRGVCHNDREGHYVTNGGSDSITLPAGATDASLTEHHVARGKQFVRERFRDNGVIDVEIICANIDNTQFPVPEAKTNQRTDDFPGLVRAADLIGQLADPNYMRKISALFMELEETGTSSRLGYRTAADLRAAYPTFFWNAVRPHIEDGLNYLRITQSGKQWVANLYAHVFAEEHKLSNFGPERLN